MTPPNELREKLKQQTVAHHQQAETKLDILNPLLTRDRYLKILESFLKVHLGLERMLMIQKDNGSNLSQDYLRSRSKIRWLQNDLSLLGSTNKSDDEVDFSWVKSESDVLGVLYVIEGSTLGGQFIAKHLREVQGWKDVGLQFFLSYGSQTGIRWSEFLNQLATAKNTDDKAVITAAQKTFDLVEHSMPTSLVSADRPNL